MTNPCGAGCPPVQSFICSADAAFANCAALELLALAGATITYWHMDIPGTTIDPLYQEPMRANRHDATRWDWESAYTFKAIIVETENTDVSSQEEGLSVQKTDLCIETARSIWGATLPEPVEGDLMIVGGTAYDVVRVGSGQWFQDPLSLTSKIYLAMSDEYIPDRRL